MLNLKKLRNIKGLNQKQVADFLGVTRPTYTRYEAGEREPDKHTLNLLADFFDVSIDYLLGRTNSPQNVAGIQIPVLGEVQAGLPISAITDIIDYEEITPAMASLGEHFALKVKGSSMEPKFSHGDVVIVRQQSDIDNGDIAIVLIDGESATIKKIQKSEDGIILIATNSNYEPIFYNNEQIEELPVIILGKVIELRAKF